MGHKLADNVHIGMGDRGKTIRVAQNLKKGHNRNLKRLQRFRIRPSLLVPLKVGEGTDQCFVVH